ncbi:MAG: ABC transporter substrate-binding protein, partial [Candidatus Hodarchaeota archaeon]
KVVLSKADATFLQRLTYTVAWPISPNGDIEYGTISGDPDHIPEGLGPYMVDTWTKDTEIVLVPNPHYFGTAPENTKVIVKFYAGASALLLALESGEIDVAHRKFGPDEVKTIEADADLRSATKETSGIRYIVINCEIVTDANVRRAIAAAVDRAEFTKVIWDDTADPLYSMVPETFTAHIDAFQDGTLTDVESNMTAAGYSTSNPYTQDLWYTPSHYGSTEADVAQLLQAQLEATGYFDLELQAAEWSAYKQGWGTMQIFLLGWWFDYPDPSNYIDPFVGAGAYSLGVNYSSVTMDGYINTMLTNTNPELRLQAQKDAQNLIATDCPVIPLFTMDAQFIAYQPDVVGVVLEPSENVHYNSIYITEEPPPTTTTTPTTEPTDTTEDGAPGFNIFITLAAMTITGVAFAISKKKRKI